MKLSDVSMKLICITAVVSGAAAGIGCIFLADRIGYLAGIAAGVAFSVLRIALMERSAKISLNMPKDKAGNYMQIQFLIRYGLTAVVLFGTVLLSAAMFYGVALSLLCLQIAGYLSRLFIKDKQPAVDAPPELRE